MKRYAAVIFLLLLTGIAAFSFPMRLMNWQDEKRVGTSQVETVERVQLTSQTELTMAEKLELMTSGRASTMALVNGKYYDPETIRVKAKEELQRLEAWGMLDLEEQDLIFGVAEVIFYMDSEDASRTMMLWNLDGYAGNCYVTCVLDDETGKIVNVSQYGIFTDAVSSVTGQESSDSEQENAKNEAAETWGDYLGLTLTGTFPSDLEEGWTEFEKEVRLYADYEDEGGRASYLFRFGEGNVYFSAELSM